MKISDLEKILRHVRKKRGDLEIRLSGDPVGSEIHRLDGYSIEILEEADEEDLTLTAQPVLVLWPD